MTGKILILTRPMNRLEIQDEDDGFTYSLIYDITHISKSSEKGEYELFDRDTPGCYYRGIVENVIEVKEKWENETKIK